MYRSAKVYRTTLIYVGLGLVISLAALLLSWLGLFKSLELKTLDWEFNNLHTERDGSNHIIIVYVEEGVMAEKCRHFYAAFLEKYAQKAGVIGLDILLDKPNIDYPERDKALEQVLEKAASENAGVYLVFGEGDERIDLSGDEKAKLEESAWELDPDLRTKLIPLEKTDLPLFMFYRHAAGIGHAYTGREDSREDIIREIPLLINCGGKIYPALALQVLHGYLGVDTERTEVRLGKHIKLATEEGSIKIPIDEKARILIDYVGGKDRFQSYTLNQCIVGGPTIDDSHIVLVGARVERRSEPRFSIGLEFQDGLDRRAVSGDLLQQFENKGFPLSPNARVSIERKGKWQISDSGRIYVVTREGQRLDICEQEWEGEHDARPTPFSSEYPGVAIHANIIDNILRGKFLRRAGMVTNSVIVVFLGLLGGAAISIAFLPRQTVGTTSSASDEPGIYLSIYAFGAIVLFIALLSAAYFGIVALLFRRGLWVSLVAPISVLLVTLVAYLFISAAEAIRHVAKDRETVIKLLRLLTKQVVIILVFLIGYCFIIYPTNLRNDWKANVLVFLLYLLATGLVNIRELKELKDLIRILLQS